MRIESVDIQNFRKLASVRIDLSDTTTLLVGANNSGKTSALDAVKKFLIDGASGFTITDVTLSNWKDLNKIGESWDLLEEHNAESLLASPLNAIMPMLDLWLEVHENELHRVSTLIPSLSWVGGLVGVRIALEAKDIKELYREYMAERRRNLDALKEAKSNGKKSDSQVELWPSNLADFLSRRMSKHFAFRYYALDSSLRKETVNAILRPQLLEEHVIALSENPIRSLIRIDSISAQRGFSDSVTTASSSDDLSNYHDSGRLSRQLSSYYKRHLDPSSMPSGKDIEAIAVIAEAQKIFDTRLADAFSEALQEIEGLGYPGVSDPRIRISSKLNPEQSLAHDSAVSFLIDVDGKCGESLHLPEAHNGLGYQNLISMIFQLMSFRDKWLRVGKEGAREHSNGVEPIHLVLVEEPEAHLHVQVQQVFARKAYEVLCKSEDIEANGETLSTQLLMSTHSSHVSHELPFAKLRYFRRLPAGTECVVPTSQVVSLTRVFGDKDETDKFVSRYLRAHHSELFFADAVIIVEGNAERMLLPNLIRTNKNLTVLDSAFITILEINGSHAHRFKNLIEKLKIPTLVITDLDPTNNRTSCPVKRNKNQVTANSTLTKWGKFSNKIDELLSLSAEEKAISVAESSFKIRFAYQTPIEIKEEDDGESSFVDPTTFEDALALENPEFFASLNGNGLTKKFCNILTDADKKPTEETAQKLFDALQNGSKSELMLDILAAENFEDLKIPSYIYEGLIELQCSVSKRLDSLNQDAVEV